QGFVIPPIGVPPPGACPTDGDEDGHDERRQSWSTEPPPRGHDPGGGSGTESRGRKVEQALAEDRPDDHEEVRRQGPREQEEAEGETNERRPPTKKEDPGGTPEDDDRAADRRHVERCNERDLVV